MQFICCRCLCCLKWKTLRWPLQLRCLAVEWSTTIIRIWDGGLLCSPGWTDGTQYDTVTPMHAFNLRTHLLQEHKDAIMSGSSQDEVNHLKPLFEKYIERTLNFKKRNCKELIPITELSGVTSLCRLYDSLATPRNGV